MTTYKTPFGDMAHGDQIGVPLSEWEAKTGVKAANGATYDLKGGAFLRLFNVNEPALLVVEQVGVECVAPDSGDMLESGIFVEDPAFDDDEPDIA